MFCVTMCVDNSSAALFIFVKKGVAVLFPTCNIVDSASMLQCNTVHPK